MATRFELTFDCSDPAVMSTFWTQALGYEIEGPPEGFDSWEDWLKLMEVPEDEWDDGASIVDPEGVGPRIFFQAVPERKTVKNRIHPDLDVSRGRSVPIEERRRQVGEEVDRLLALGGRRVSDHEQGDHYHVVMQDPEGNEFCLR